VATVALGYGQPSLTPLNHSERLGPAGAHPRMRGRPGSRMCWARPTQDREPVLKKREAVAAAFASTVRELQATGFVSRRSIADELNRRRVRTERGGRWYYTTVVRMLMRLGMDKPVCGAPGSGAASRWAATVRVKALAPTIRDIQSAGIVTSRAIAWELNARGVPAPRGGKWHPTSVHRLLRRIERLAARSRVSPGRQSASTAARSRVAACCHC
jgi:hypothetical protein